MVSIGTDMVGVGENVQNVLRLDDQAPACPDSAGASEGSVLGKGEGLCWACEVGNTSKDEGPLIRVSCVIKRYWYRRGVEES